MSTLSKYHTLPDGAKIAYEVIGSQHLGRSTPIILVCGLSCLGGDWERLSNALANCRPVLVYDNRGLGNSTYSTPEKNDSITIESMARDLLELLQGLQWKEVALCGFSMGGVIVQQLLLLPSSRSNPTKLPFKVTHVLLSGTMAAPLRKLPPRLKFTDIPVHSLTRDEKREVVRDLVECMFDPVWVHDEKNRERLNWWLDRMTAGRPFRTIQKQRRAMGRFDLSGLGDTRPRDTPLLIIHGPIDEVVPFEAGQEIISNVPWARMIEVGSSPGQIPHNQFGHNWWEYFDIKVWVDVVEAFLREGPANVGRSRL